MRVLLQQGVNRLGIENHVFSIMKFIEKTSKMQRKLYVFYVRESPTALCNIPFRITNKLFSIFIRNR